MKCLITGLSGTLAPHLARVLAARGFEVVGWDRGHLPPEDAASARAWLERTRPDAIAHLAMGGAAWAGRLAAFAGESGLPFVFTSTAMVFDHQPDGPHAPHDPRTARDEYGRSKIASEDAILAAHPAAMIVRIGWQIDDTGEGRHKGNHMLAALDAWHAERGEVAASRTWRPACSFMHDTAAALATLLQMPHPGVHHLDSNAGDGWHFAQLAAALQRRFGRTNWRIRETEDYRHDQRLIGGALALPPLSARLPLST